MLQCLSSVVVLVRMFMAQVGSGGSCREAIEQAIQQGWIPSDSSSRTGAYCNARQGLPEQPLRKLAMGVGLDLEQSSEAAWCGRQVRVVDGSSVQLPDTQDNQEFY